MSYGAYDFNIVQFGREATAGTAVAATEIHRGPAIDIEDMSAYQRTEEQTGIMALTGNYYLANKQALLNLPSYPFTFEHGPHIFEGGILTATPTGTGPTVRTYPFDVTTTDVATKAIKTYTWESANALVGDGNEMEYSFVESFTLTGAINEAWMAEPVWRGRQKTVAAMTGALTLDTVEESKFANATLYVDATGGTVGTTAITGVMVGATINVERTGVVPVWAPSGNLYFSNHKFIRPIITGSFTFELENDEGLVVAERAFWVAGTKRLIRIKTTGTTTKYWQFDASINWTSFGTYTDMDGDTVVTAEWEAIYSATDTLLAEFEVGNAIANYDA